MFSNVFTYTDEEFEPIPGVNYLAKKRTIRFFDWPILMVYIG
jgi:hypothetical protein